MSYEMGRFYGTFESNISYLLKVNFNIINYSAGSFSKYSF